MKNTSINPAPARLLGIISVILLACTLSAPAETLSWWGTGLTANWSDSGNWTNSLGANAVPANGDALTFPNAVQTVNNNDLSGLSVGSLTLATGNFDFSGNPLTIASGVANSAGDNIFEFPVTLSAAQTFQVDGGSLTFNSSITNTGDLIIAGVGNVTWNNTATLGLKGAGNLIVNGPGALTLPGGFLNPGVNFGFAGNTIVNGGQLLVQIGNWANYSVFGNSLTINPGGSVRLDQPHPAGATGVPLYVYGGTIDWNMDNGAYFTTVVLSNATVTSTTGSGDLRGTGILTNLASAGTTTFGAILNLGNGVHTVGVDLGTADPAIDFTANATSAINGSGNLTKLGPGKMRISGPAIHTGNTIISAGTLALANTMANTPSITVAANAVFDISGTTFSLNTNQTLAGVGTVLGTLNDSDPGATGSVLSPGGDSAAGTLTMEGLNLSGNSLALTFNLANVTTVGSGINDLLIVTNLTLSPGAANTVNFTFSGTPAPGAYTLIQYPLNQGPAAGPVTALTAAASRYTYTFTSTGTAIQMAVVPHPAPLVWRGDGTTNTWDLATTTNWMNGAVKDVFLTGDNATFNDTGSNAPPINLVGALSANIVTVNATKDYTFAGSGKISGGSSLVKNNSGNLTILTGNDNSGGGSLSGAGVINVGNGGGTGALGTGSLTNNTKVTFFLNTGSTYGGNMSGAGSVVSFMPAATLTVTGTNTYTGGTTISNGTFQIGNATAGSSVAGNITNYGTLNLYRSDAFTNKNTITSAGNTFEYGDGNINLRGVGGMTVDGTAPISIGGGFSVGQSASGKLTVNSGGLINIGGSFLLGNPNNAAYYGDVTQNGGSISVGNQVRVGHWASEISYYAMNGGTLNVPNNQVAVGWDGIGVMTMSGGTVNCRTFNVDDNTATGAIGGTNSTFTMTGGLLNLGPGGIGGNTSTINLGGGTIAAAAPAGFSSSKAMTLTSGNPTFDSSNSVITLSGILSGTNGLLKQGTGYLNLNGVNTFTGAVTVANGTLEGTGTVAGPVIVQSGASLSAGGVLGAGTLTLNDVTMNSGAGMIFDLSSTAATGDQLVVKGNLALDSVGTPATLNFLGGVPYTGVPYTLITNWVPRTGNLVLAPSGLTRYTAWLDQGNANRIQVSFSGANADLVWKGTPNNRWNVNGDANWLNGGVADKYYQSDAVLFDATGIGTPNVALASNMTPASVTVNAAGNYSFSGAALAGVGTLTKSGSGTLTISNNVNLTGTTTVNGGTLRIGNGGTTGYVAGNIANYGSVVFNRSDTVAYGINPVNAGTSVISGPGSLTQAGAGTLLILATMNHYGGTTINPGSTVQLGNGATVDVGSLGNSPATNNGTLKFYRLSNVGVGTPLTGNGTFNFLGTGNSGQSGYVLNATNTFTGPVTLSYARLQSGAGALSFGSPSSLTVQPGSQVYATATPYSSVYNIPLTLAGTGWRDGLGALRIENTGTWAGPITLAANARIGVNNATTNTITGNITGNYELETYGGNAAAALILAPSSANTYNALRVSIGTAGAATIAGNANAIPNNIPLTMNGGTIKLNGFSKSFAPFYNLSGSSSLQNGSAASPATIGLTPAAGVSLNYNGTFADGGAQPLHVTMNQTSPPWTVTLGGSSPNWTGSLTNNGGAIVVATGSTYMGNNNAPNRFIVANNGGAFTWNVNNVFGNGVANSFFPTIILNPGCALSNNNYNVIGPVVLNGATLTGTRTTTGGYKHYQFRGPVTVTGSAPSVITCLPASTGPGLHLDTATTFDVANVTGNANSDLLVSEPLLDRSADYGGAGGLVKTGSGTMELEAANTYTGSTVVSNGTLKLGASASLASPSISVGSGATLDVSAAGLTLAAQTLRGGGTVVGTVTDGASSVISPGSSVGTLAVGGLTLTGGGGKLAFELSSTSTTTGGGVNDLIQVTGALSLNDAAPTPVEFTFLNGPNAAGTYTIMTCGSISGTAAGLTNYQGYPVTFAIVGTSVRATFAAAPGQSLVWQGGDPAGNTWDLATTTTNWFNGTVDTNFYQLDNVRFDDTRTTVNTTVDIAASVYPASITFDSTNNYTLQGAGKITGVTSITKNNTNTVIMNAINDAAGPINVNAGTYALGQNDTYVGATTITVATGAAFNFAGMNDNVLGLAHTFVIAGAGPDGQGALRSELYDIYSYANVSNLTLTADSVIGSGLDGSGAATRWDIGPVAKSMLDGRGNNLTKVGGGTISMRPQIITNLASLTVSNGLVYYENYDQTNSWTATTTNYIKPGATLGSYGGRTLNMPIVLDGATVQSQNGTPNWIGDVRVDFSSLFRNNLAQNFYGVISGPGAMWVDGGTAALTLTNANTYAGGTIISNAPVTTSAVDATAGSAAVIAKDPSAFGTGPITINGSAYASLSTNPSFFLTNVLRAVEFAFPAPGTVPNNIVLPTSLINNVSLHGRDSGQVINLAGQISGGFPGMTNWVDFGDATGVGVMRYGNAANNFIGNISAFRGLLAVTGDGALGNSANILRLNNNGGLRFDAPGINVAHNISATAATTFNLFGDNNGDGVPDTVNNATISGVVSGAAGTINFRGTNGVLTLTANNTYSGSWELVEPVTLQVAASANLGTAAVALKAGTLRYTGAGSETMTRSLWNDNAALTGATIDIVNSTASLVWNPAGGTCNQPLFKTGAGALTLGTLGLSGNVTANGGSLTVNSVISGAATVVRVNSGALTLSGANTYTGGTLVNGGTLFVNGSLPVGNVVTVASGATLGGYGTINGPVDLQAGSALRPGAAGNSIGTLTIASTLALSGTTTTTMEINGNLGDSVVAMSTVTYGGTLTVNNLGTDPAPGTKFTLFNAAARYGSFGSVTLPAFTIPNRAWVNTLGTDGGIQVAYTGSMTAPTITNGVSGGNLNLSWPAANIGWKLLVQTNNLATGVSTNLLDWDVVPGSQDTNAMSLPIDPAKPSQFYRMVSP